MMEKSESLGVLNEGNLWGDNVDLRFNVYYSYVVTDVPWCDPFLTYFRFFRVIKWSVWVN